MNEESKVRIDAIFAGCNRQTNCLDFSKSKTTIAYGSNRHIGLWKPLNEENRGTYELIKGHNKEVTCVRFIEQDDCLVSCSEDSVVMIWKEKKGKYECINRLQRHNNSVTCLGVFDKDIFVTGDSGGKLIFWSKRFNEKEFDFSFEFDLQEGFYPLTLSLQLMQKPNMYFLIVGGTSKKIHVFFFKLNDKKEIEEFEQTHILEGHENWVKCSLIIQKNESSFLIATGSLDKYVRIWKLDFTENFFYSNFVNRNNVFQTKSGITLCVSFDALLSSNSECVMDLKWSPDTKLFPDKTSLNLVSCTSDSQLLIWQINQDTDVWYCINLLGDVSLKGSSTATGSSGGFWSCHWFSDEKNDYIVASCRTGSIRLYKSFDRTNKLFESILGITGFTLPATSVSWSKNGDFFSATSLDKTCRLFSTWEKGRTTRTWHEFSRSQIHGYGLIDVDYINDFTYVSCAEEKILRVFEFTSSTIDLLRNLSNTNILDPQIKDLMQFASIPVLGLSNKSEDHQTDLQEKKKNSNSLHPPIEDDLQRNTLFPEIEKLYGHGHDLSCCAVSPDATCIASSCKSNTIEHAVIKIFNIKKGYLLSNNVLKAHSLTVTSLKFSSDSSYLLSVSRDRLIAVWYRESSQHEFSLLDFNPSAHSRIIWDCDWLPKFNNYYFFLTVSRDKCLKFWSILEGKINLLDLLTLCFPIVSLSCHKCLFEDKAVFAIALENGSIYFYTVTLTLCSPLFLKILEIPSHSSPSEKVSCLSFNSKLYLNRLQLCVTSCDNTVSIYSFDKSLIEKDV